MNVAARALLVKILEFPYAFSLDQRRAYVRLCERYRRALLRAGLSPFEANQRAGEAYVEGQRVAWQRLRKAPAKPPHVRAVKAREVAWRELRALGFDAIDPMTVDLEVAEP